MTARKVTIERLGHLGEGIAAGPLYVPRTLPGEVVEGVVDGTRMPAPRILSPSPDRVRPPCRHVRACGGCALQHASDDFLARWKREVVEQALAAQGLAQSVRGMVTSPPGSRRRAVLAARRVKSGVQVGFHGLRSHLIAEIDDCRLLRPELLAQLPLVKALTRAGASRNGQRAVTLTLLDGGVDIAVKGGKTLDQSLFETLGELLRPAKGVVRLTWNDELVASLAPATLTIGRAPVPLPPGAFLQATREGEAALAALVDEATAGATRIADLFAGAGTFALRLAERAEVHGVEGAPALVQALAAGWRAATGLRRITTEARDLFRRPLLPDELAGFDALVLDPPRAGAEAQVVEIARSRVHQLAMVSCNPVTFARDARILSDAGFAIEWVEIVDQFRWSAHVELVARMCRG